MANRDRKRAEERRRKVIDLVTGNEAVMAQYRASRASWERGEKPIPGGQVRADAKARRERA
jgi:hypothetical protein